MPDVLGGIAAAPARAIQSAPTHTRDRRRLAGWLTGFVERSLDELRARELESADDE